MALEGKCALVTGAGTGIGREVALELARQGADVVLNYYSNDQGASSAVQEVRSMGRRAWTIQADLGRPDAPGPLVDQAIALLGRLDILVNNAGVTMSKAFVDVTAGEFDAIYNVNIRGQYLCAQSAARQMIQQGAGVIINMTSLHAYAGLPGASVYAGTKGAIVAWTRQVAMELAPLGVRVVAVAPGAIAVPRTTANPDWTKEDAGREIPLGRMGEPSDIAKTCAFLASEDAEFIVGTTITVDGGTTGRMYLHLADQMRAAESC